MRKEGRQFTDNLIDPGGQRFRGNLVVGEIAIRGINRGRQRMSHEEAEERPQLVFHHQCMPVAAAGCRDDDGLGAQLVWIDKIDEMLEKSRI